MVEESSFSRDAGVVQRNKSMLRQLLAALLMAPPTQVSMAIDRLVQSAMAEGDHFAGGGVPSNSAKDLADLIIQLHLQYPKDVGLFMPFLLNYAKLNPGEAIYLDPGDVHAYLSGGKRLIPCTFSAGVNNLTSHTRRR